jgi:hypothetical protein
MKSWHGRPPVRHMTMVVREVASLCGGVTLAERFSAKTAVRIASHKSASHLNRRRKILLGVRRGHIV